MKVAIALLALLAFYSRSLAKERPDIVGTYSSLYYNNEGGDLLGYEVSIVRDKQGYIVRFQVAEGSPSEVVNAPLQVRGNRIAFVIPKSKDGAGRYSGTVTKAGWLVEEGSSGMWALAGPYPPPSKPFLLKRKCSYWVKCPTSPRHGQ